LGAQSLIGAFVIRRLLDLRSLACFCDCDVASSATLRQWSIRRGITDAVMSPSPLFEIAHLKGHYLSLVSQTVARNSKPARGSPATRPFCMISSVKVVGPS